jgi:intraflagellar transport protein 172
LRVCKEYLPHKLKALQDEFDQQSLAESGRDVNVLLDQAQQWVETGEYERAVDCYLKVDRSNTNDTTTMASAWTKAAELAIKFLDSDKAIDVAQIAGPNLVMISFLWFTLI